VEGIAGVLRDIMVIFVAAKLASEALTRLKQPAVIGELLVGVLIGPYALGWVGRPDAALVDLFHGDEAVAAEALQLTLHTLSELGVIVLLFFVGLETRLADVLRVGRRAGSVAVAGVVVPFGLGYGLLTLLGNPSLEAIFVGTALVATSVGITARVLSDLGRLDSLEARIILGAAVIDDILGMLLLGVVAGLGVSGQVSYLSIAAIALEAVGFVALVALVGSRVVRRYSVHLDTLRLEDAPFAVAIAVCLGLAIVAATIGLAGIIGAFLAGMAFAEARERYALEIQALPLYRFLVPFFFVVTGAQVDWRLFLDPGVVGLALGVTVLAIVGKLVGCGGAAWGLGRTRTAIIAVGMAPRGEVGLIVASLGRSLSAIDDRMYSVVVIMSVLTTLVVPPVLAALYRGAAPAPPEAEEEPDEERGYARADHVRPEL
jgi:Kef-type K+ transport system membrane component KefB